MTQKLVVKKQCERCPRVEEHEVDLETVRKSGFSLDPDVKSIRIDIDGDEIGNFEYLCDTCREIVNNYVVSILSTQTKVSSHRKKKSKGEEEVEVTVTEEAAE